MAALKGSAPRAGGSWGAVWQADAGQLAHECCEDLSTLPYDGAVDLGCSPRSSACRARTARELAVASDRTDVDMKLNDTGDAQQHVGHHLVHLLHSAFIIWSHLLALDT